MSALYNEIDPKAAQWTRNLIAAGRVAPGVVDERSISDLVPTDVAGVGQRHFFAGIAGWSLALRLAGIADDTDVWTGSCPCQGFSSAGRQRGFDDPRHLWPIWFGLISECRPPVVLGEQVASRLGWAWLDLVFADLEGAGYACAAADLPACSVGAPHRRQRLFFVAYADEGRRARPRLHLRPGRSGEAKSYAGRSSEIVVANASGARLEVVGEQQARRQLEAAERGGTAVGVADTSGERRGGLPRDHGARREQSELAGGRAARNVADTDDAGRGPRRVDGPHGWPPIEPARLGDAVRVGDTGSVGSGRNARAVPGEETSGSGQRDIDRRVADEPVTAGSAHSGWRNCEWIPCSDGVSRPVEPGTHPLAHGVPGRVGLLRGYGNAINPELAATFIRAAMRAA